jgi:hypothetical protein
MDKPIARDQVINELKKITPLLYQKYGVTSIGIFGSVARNQASVSNDIDIVFQIDKPNLFTTVHIKEELENIFHIPVDLVRYRKNMNPYLKKRIDSECIYVQ